MIEIKSSAVVKGNLIAPRIQLEDGGKFRGSMDMIDSEEEKRERNEEFKAKLIHPHLPPTDNVPSKAPAKSNSMIKKPSQQKMINLKKQKKTTIKIR